MTLESQQLAQKLSAHSEWKWEGGALTACGIRVLDGGKGWIVGHRAGETRDGGGWVDTIDVSGFVPDLDHRGTIGTIEGQVREICPQAVLWPPENPGEPWVINDGIMDHLAEGATRGEVWAHAFLGVAG